MGKIGVSILALAALLGAAGCSKAPAGAGAAGAPAAPALPGINLGGDPCQTVFASLVAMTKHDHASDMTMTDGSNPPNQAQEVTVGGKSYLKVGGVWKVSPMTPDQEVEMMNENLKTSTQTCKAAGDDVVGGQPASVVEIHAVNKDVTSDNRVWLSKASGLPLKLESKMDGGMSTSQTVSYDNVSAPSVSAAPPA
jgi:hypothetical protein